MVRYEQVRVRLEDNFDTAGAVSELLLLVKDVHSYIDKCNSVCSFPPPSCPYLPFVLWWHFKLVTHRVLPHHESYIRMTGPGKMSKEI